MSRRSRRVLAFFLCGVLSVGTLLSTSSGGATAAQDAGGGPVLSEVSKSSLAASYLSARIASAEKDTATAAAYWRQALRKDPKNVELMERAFIALLNDGSIEEAIQLADQLVTVDRTHRLARLVRGVRAIKAKQYGQARTDLSQSVRGPIADLTATLLTGWTWMGSKQVARGVSRIEQLQGPEWYEIFKNLHIGLLYDAAGQPKPAGPALERAYKLDSTALRTVEAYGRWASRMRTPDEARKIFASFDKVLPRHPVVVQAMTDLSAGKKLSPYITTPQQGAAEVLYGLGASLGRQGGEDLAMVYLQLALYLEPDQALALLSLADLYDQLKRPQQAIEVYARVPESSPLRRNADIQRSANLDALDRPDEAIAGLKRQLERIGNDAEAVTALGNIYRTRKRWAECVETYDRAVDLIDASEKRSWLIFYFRGICHERSKNWAKAEPDLQKALALYPDQPQVLNYLGYSWIDQGIRLDEAMGMIRKAVQLRPEDGYIVDSLGWAHYRLGNYEEATKTLERAVELKPDDPVINDHLGDAYWQVGRRLEARFQWSHAKDMTPEPDDLQRIIEKLKKGLVSDKVPNAAADPKAEKKPDNGG